MKYLTTLEVAHELEVSKQTLLNWLYQGKVPEPILITTTTARIEQPADGVAGFRFFPEGASTGGRIVLSRERAAWQVDVDWLTGEVTLVRAEAPR